MRRRPGVRAPEGRWLTATSRAGHRVCRRRRHSRPAVAAIAETRDWCWREPLHHELPLQTSDASHLTSSPRTHCAIAQPPCPKCRSACCGGTSPGARTSHSSHHRRAFGLGIIGDGRVVLQSDDGGPNLGRRRAPSGRPALRRRRPAPCLRQPPPRLGLHDGRDHGHERWRHHVADGTRGDAGRGRLRGRARWLLGRAWAPRGHGDDERGRVLAGGRREQWARCRCGEPHRSSMALWRKSGGAPR